MKSVSHSMWPCYSDKEVKIVTDILRSNRVNYWTGTEGKRFETEFAEWSNCTKAIALANGSVALQLALKALEIGPGDEVVVTPRSFLASVSEVVLAGATPVFADVDADSQVITAESIAKVLSDKTKAIICVHLAGWPCDMDSLLALAAKHDLKIIEDCAQAHGATYRGKSVGSFGDVGAWSFCQDKIMTTGGEGGMVTTNDEALWEKMWSYKDHGKGFGLMSSLEPGVAYKWLHESFGTNFRMTEMQSAIGRYQLTQMSEWHESRVRNATRILETCRQFPDALRAPVPESYLSHAFYKCYAFVKPEGLKQGWSRDKICSAIAGLGVSCGVGVCSEVYLERAFDGSGFRPNVGLEVAKRLGKTSIMFVIHPTLTEQEIEKTCSAIQSVMKQAAI